jgi:hypothetical protein
VPVIVADDKTPVHGHVLVDDWPPYVSRWQRRWPASLAIVPAQPWNVQAVAEPRCIRYDGKNRAAVLTALHVCRKEATGFPHSARTES